MKKLITVIAVTWIGISSNLLALVTITGFGTVGTNPFNTGTDFLAPWSGTQNSATVSVAGVSNQSGGIFSTLGTPVNITGQTARLQLIGSLTGTTTTDSFQISLYDAEFDEINYNFSWSAFAGGTQTVTVNLNAPNAAFSGTVSSWGLNLFGSPGDTVSFTFDNLAATTAVPEPSTYALLALGVVGLAVYRRRLA
jgi:hypothetical protein